LSISLVTIRQQTNWWESRRWRR